MLPFPVSVSTSVIIVQVLLRWLYGWDFMGVAFLAFLRDKNLTSEFLFLLLYLYSLPTPLSTIVPEPQVQELCLRCIRWVLGPRSHFGSWLCFQLQA